MDDWLRLIRNKEKRHIARLISRIENGDPQKTKILEQLYPFTGNAWLIGITGPPGAGKSSLLDGLIHHLRGQKKTVGVIAVDPTSPFTGGAILGDRVRMTRHALDKDVFIRSMGSRGSLGGLSRAAKEAARVLDAAGYDVVLIETVGVGQAELDIMNIADTVALVLNPGAGDVVQVFKAGIMEAADLFIINKADLPGAARLQAEIEELLDLVKQSHSWRPPIVQTVSTKNEGIENLWAQMNKHRRYLEERGEWSGRRKRHLKEEVQEVIEDMLRRRLELELSKPEFQMELQQVAERKKVPQQVAREWLERVLGKTGGEI
ncbi:methylmalonyl Co-A mutase-associated GTPase MeaB [Paenactinomyces guangxiensis]|uniref:Methylmalonyl Co-A mutase-associated GTPase MeaB n=1 Tax=Paenactinomyces guangxiensis TaxID=1490290 RepID=A0A7W1WQ62_9BACL|nr:methylmalonyl Co-A mutase-associated GTPase MeaB [Paenactinomyces guangxiensis]MBA4494035.1 methylmalonyl Co-A mutase-associated GTPase MeaB [Paenactinomyces guangxiensis]MBH8591220.1 methylmalonyl Co-A mutase-associated GTPase MeaB [Paenactinomyces guangxiensis]